MAHMKNVELGFLENTDSFLLKSRFFPSKFGGTPAWLSLKNLPTPEELSCRNCSKQTVLLLQIYSPVDTSDCFHRTVFVFVCVTPECCKPNDASNFHVFRSQLGRENDFYSSEPPVEARIENDTDASLFNKICQVCGCLAPKTCAKCHKVDYCSKEHQTIDWKKFHKQECGSKAKDDKLGGRPEKIYSLLFQEMEIITEEENYAPANTNVEKTEAEKMKEYKEFVTSQKGSEVMETLSEKELQDMANTETDKQLRLFKERISSVEPDQVLRYNKGGEPLWIANTPKPDNVPNCQCGSKRQFEFQVLPQLLSHMDVDKLGASLDWGTLCVYTCADNCSIQNQYSREYIFKQDIV